MTSTLVITLTVTMTNGVRQKTYGRAWLETDYIIISASCCPVALPVIVSLLSPPPPEGKWRPFLG